MILLIVHKQIKWKRSLISGLFYFVRFLSVFCRPHQITNFPIIYDYQRGKLLLIKHFQYISMHFSIFQYISRMCTDGNFVLHFRDSVVIRPLRLPQASNCCQFSKCVQTAYCTADLYSIYGFPLDRKKFTRNFRSHNS